MTEPARPELEELARECEQLGYLNGFDFQVWGVPAQLSSELVVIGYEDGRYVVWYRDMGRSRELFASPSFTDARAAFLEHLARVAHPRGRGPAPHRTSEWEGMTPEEVYAEMKRSGWFR